MTTFDGNKCYAHIEKMSVEIGPRVSGHLRDRWLQAFLGVVLLLIGLRYLGGF